MSGLDWLAEGERSLFELGGEYCRLDCNLIGQIFRQAGPLCFLGLYRSQKLFFPPSMVSQKKIAPGYAYISMIRQLGGLSSAEMQREKGRASSLDHSTSTKGSFVT